ncbi:hypothetical protein AVEN_7464-1 [Araneus ventricosus]|uniref:Thyroglobulin type-1 domain-containing protein n=1 Tax=Araneus ventricosus TaxID=182803 RepID=A0A4Y2UIJ2_ARAVE|nr:hypothetical protein AVEN_7464-1 [Araneus ventricosus]
MLRHPSRTWMTPKCNKDGSFQELQCFDNPGPDDCMCVYKNGAALTRLHQGRNITQCFCYAIAYERYLKDKRAGVMKCDDSGYFKPLQCPWNSNKCSCVSKYGEEVAPPSRDRKSCDDVAHLL